MVYTEENLPKEFKFKNLNTNTVTRANTDNGRVFCTWQAGSENFLRHMDYPVAKVCKWLNSEEYEMCPPPNGVDTNGNKIHFGTDDLKYGMRVKTAKGDVGVILHSVQEDSPWSGLQLFYTSYVDWNSITFDVTNTSQSNIVEVYKVRYNSRLLNSEIVGYDELIWKYVDFEVEAAQEKKHKLNALSTEYDRLENQIVEISQAKEKVYQEYCKLKDSN
jgi:hypothetical protein